MPGETILTGATSTAGSGTEAASTTTASTAPAAATGATQGSGQGNQAAADQNQGAATNQAAAAEGKTADATTKTGDQKAQGKEANQGKDGTKPDDAKQTTDAKPGAPEAYDLKLPKDAVLPAEAITRIAEVAKKMDLTQAQAQQLLEHENATIASHQKAVQDQWKQTTTKQWVEQARADKEIGGDKFKASAEAAYRFVDRFGTPEFKQALEATGLGNNPEFVRVFARAGLAMAEDTFVGPSGANGGKADEAVRLQRRYPSMFPST